MRFFSLFCIVIAVLQYVDGAAMPKLVLGYWRLRGLVAPIQYLLAVTGLEYEFVVYELEGLKENPEKSKYYQDRDSLGLAFPNLPYLIDGDVRITQSLAVLKYLARKTGLLGIAENASPQEYAQLEMIQEHVIDLRKFYFDFCTGDKVIEFRFPEGYPASIPRQLNYVAAWLKDKSYLLGDNISYVDFILYETLDVQKLINPDCLAKHPNLVAYVDRIESLPGMKKFLASPERITWPVLGPIMGIKWGYKRE